MTDFEFSDSDHSLEPLSISSSDDEMDLLQVRQRVKNQDYFEITVRGYSDQEFFKHFRVSREVARRIAEQFAASNYFTHHAGEFGKISAFKCIAIFLWFVGHEAASFRDVSDRFAIALSSLFKISRKVTYFLSNLSPQIIEWPRDNEAVVITQYFSQHRFPGVIGIIDGTHIKIDRPSDDPDSYLNRKHFYSIHAQIVCDHTRKIRDVFIGFPGSVHDSRVFRASPLSDSIAQKCGNFYLLGDSGYPCLRHLLTPYKDRGQLTNAQNHYNLVLATNRYIVEHCIGILKQKFRQLYHLKLRNIEDMVHLIRATCVLHNLALNDDFQVLEENVNIPAYAPPNQNNQNQPDERDDREEIEMREYIANHILQ